MFTIDELLEGMQISRSEFSKVFLRVQNTRVNNRIHFEAVARSHDRRIAYRRALEYAEKEDWLPGIIDELLAGNFITKELFARPRVPAGRSAPASQLQAILNEANGFISPGALARGTLRAMQSTVRILINGVHAGSGVLIRSQLVLTAWHVVRSLFDNADGGEWTLLNPAPPDLEIEFNTTSLALRRLSGLRSRRSVHAKWLVAHSSASDDELRDRFPSDPESLKDHYDYAIIKLDEVVDWAGFSLDERAVEPGAGSGLLVMQYPQNQPLSLDLAEIVRPAEYGIPDRLTNHRFLHKCNTLPGSSGGPCFDRDFTLVGIHQGTYSNVNGDKDINRGVPVVKILEDIESCIGELPPEDPHATRIAALGIDAEMAPVIGCDEFQRVIWESAINGKRRIFTVTGPGSGCGKTFRTEVVRAMLPNEDHLHITLPAGAIGGLGAVELAERIYSEAGVDLLHPPTTVNPNSSEAVWLRDDVIKAVVNSLEQGRQSRIVWVMITDLNRYRIASRQASELLFMLYELVEKYDWLRIVLDGMRGSIPTRAGHFLQRCTVDEITFEHVVLCVRRTMKMLHLTADDFFVVFAARRLHRRYEEARQNDSTTCLAVLQREIGVFMRDWLKSLPENQLLIEE